MKCTNSLTAVVALLVLWSLCSGGCSSSPAQGFIPELKTTDWEQVPSTRWGEDLVRMMHSERGKSAPLIMAWPEPFASQHIKDRWHDYFADRSNLKKREALWEAIERTWQCDPYGFGDVFFSAEMSPLKLLIEEAHKEDVGHLMRLLKQAETVAYSGPTHALGWPDWDDKSELCELLAATVPYLWLLTGQFVPSAGDEPNGRALWLHYWKLSREELRSECRRLAKVYGDWWERNRGLTEAEFFKEAVRGCVAEAGVSKGRTSEAIALVEFYLRRDGPRGLMIGRTGDVDAVPSLQMLRRRRANWWRVAAPTLRWDSRIRRFWTDVAGSVTGTDPGEDPLREMAYVHKLIERSTGAVPEEADIIRDKVKLLESDFDFEDALFACNWAARTYPKTHAAAECRAEAKRLQRILALPLHPDFSQEPITVDTDDRVARWATDVGEIRYELKIPADIRARPIKTAGLRPNSEGTSAEDHGYDEYDYSRYYRKAWLDCLRDILLHRDSTRRLRNAEGVRDVLVRAYQDAYEQSQAQLEALEVKVGAEEAYKAVDRALERTVAEELVALPWLSSW